MSHIQHDKQYYIQHIINASIFICVILFILLLLTIIVIFNYTDFYTFILIGEFRQLEDQTLFHAYITQEKQHELHSRYASHRQQLLEKYMQTYILDFCVFINTANLYKRGHKYFLHRKQTITAALRHNRAQECIILDSKDIKEKKANASVYEPNIEEIFTQKNNFYLAYETPEKQYKLMKTALHDTHNIVRAHKLLNTTPAVVTQVIEENMDDPAFIFFVIANDLF